MPQPERAVGDDAPDAAEADDAQRLAGDLGARPGPSPSTCRCAPAGRRAGRGARARQQERDRELRRRRRVAARRVHHDDAALGRGLAVDVVDADAGAADDAQLGRRLDHAPRDLGRRAHDERVARRATRATARPRLRPVRTSGSKPRRRKTSSAAGSSSSQIRMRGWRSCARHGCRARSRTTVGTRASLAQRGAHQRLEIVVGSTLRGRALDALARFLLGVADRDQRARPRPRCCARRRGARGHERARAPLPSQQRGALSRRSSRICSAVFLPTPFTRRSGVARPRSAIAARSASPRQAARGSRAPSPGPTPRTVEQQPEELARVARRGSRTGGARPRARRGASRRARAVPRARAGSRAPSGTESS